MSKISSSNQIAPGVCLLSLLVASLVISCNEEEVTRLRQRVIADSIKLDSARRYADDAAMKLNEWKMKIGVKEQYDYSGPASSQLMMRMPNEVSHSHAIGSVWAVRRIDSKLECLGGLFYETAVAQIDEKTDQTIIDEFVIDKSFRMNGNTLGMIVGINVDYRDSSFSRVRHSVIYKANWPQGGIQSLRLNPQLLNDLIAIVDTNVYTDVRMVTGVHRECYEQTSYRLSKTSSSMSLPVLVSDGAIYEQNGRTSFRYDLWFNYVTILRTVLAAKVGLENRSTGAIRDIQDTGNITVKFVTDAVTGYRPDVFEQTELLPSPEQMQALVQEARNANERKTLSRTKAFLDSSSIKPVYEQNEDYRKRTVVPK